jgi:transcriptional regulator with XRE-family HTH domain
MTLGNKIRVYRGMKGFSQEEMAKMLKISKTAYGDIEGDKIKVTIARLEEIAKILGTTTPDILSFGDSVSFNHTILYQNGTSVHGNGTTVQNPDAQFLIAFETLKIESNADKQRIEDLLGQIKNLNEQVGGLKEIIALLKCQNKE